MHHLIGKIFASARAAAVGLAIVAVGSMPTMTRAQEPAAASDKAMDHRIEQSLKADPTLKRFEIRASVDGGIATLTGAVPTEADKARAGQLAMVAGVTRVDNQIRVDPHAGTRGTAGHVEGATKKGARKTKEGAEKVGEKTKEGGEKVVEKTKEGAKKVGSEVSDAVIITRVHAKFTDEELLKGSHINVDSDDQIVTLRGTVPSAAAKARAAEEAKKVPGVKRVVDKLTIAPKQ